LLELGKIDEAEAVVRQYIEGEIKNEYVYQMIVIYLNRQLQEKAYQTVVSFAYEYIPQSSLYYDDYLLVLSEANIEQAKYPEALSNLTKMRRKTERSEYLIGLSNLRTGKERDAEKIFAEFSRSAENIEIRSNSFFFLAAIRGRTDIEETNKMLNQFLRANPNHPFTGAANYQLGLNYFSQKKFGDAINSLTKASSDVID